MKSSELRAALEKMEEEVGDIEISILGDVSGTITLLTLDKIFHLDDDGEPTIALTDTETFEMYEEELEESEEDDDDDVEEDEDEDEELGDEED